MSINILDCPAQTVVGMEIRTKPMSPDIPALWPRFVSRIDEIENTLEPNVSYGVMWNGESRDILHYIAAISVAKSSRVPSGMTLLILPGGNYASFRYPLSGLAKGFGEIFGRVLPASGYVQCAGPFFERYDEAFNPADSNSMVEIRLPVNRPTASTGYGSSFNPGVRLRF